MCMFNNKRFRENMRNQFLTIMLLYLLFCSCESKKIEGVYSSNEGPLFKFTKGKFFEFGIPNDPAPLKGNFTVEGDKLNLLANSIILGSYATTNFICTIKNDTLTIEVFNLVHPRFEIYINKSTNYAKTRRDTVISEFKLNTLDAEEELFIYYKLVHDKFIKRKGETK